VRNILNCEKGGFLINNPHDVGEVGHALVHLSFRDANEQTFFWYLADSRSDLLVQFPDCAKARSYAEFVEK
jgi:hypothetical protein